MNAELTALEPSRTGVSTLICWAVGLASPGFVAGVAYRFL
jgi:hypothetical protein